MSTREHSQRRIVPRLFLTFYFGLALVTLASIVISWSLLAGRVRTMAERDVSERLASETTLVAQMTKSALLGPLSDDDTAVFSEDLRSIAGTTHTRISLVGADGTVIVDSESANAPRITDEQRAGVATAGSLEILDDAALVSVQPITRNGKILGYARSTCSVAVIDARMRTLQRWAILIGLIFGATTMLLGLALAQRVVTPIVGLERATERIASGEFDVPIPTTRIDEIGDLARSFKKMSHQLKKMMLDLETRERETREFSLVKDHLYVRLSHELRTPCNALFNTLGLLKDEDVSLDARDTLQAAIKASEMLAIGLRDLDDFAQADVSEVAGRTTSFDPRAAVDDALRAAGVSSTSSSAITQNVAGGARTPIRGDAFRLRFAVRSAALFLLEGLPNAALTVDVDVVRTHVAELRARLTLKQTGSRADRIFGVDTHNARAAYLAMCRHLVEATGGRVELEEGSATTLTLHTTNELSDSNDEPLKVERVIMERNEAANETQTTRVLLVEDEPVNRLIARRVLEKQGFAVTVAENGARALEVLRETVVDVVLMDIDMPVMNGIEAVAKIREGEVASTRHLPVIAMTAHAMDGDRARFLAAGMDDCVTKPFNPPDLKQIVQKWSSAAVAA